MTELGVGCSMTLSMRWGCPRSTTMNRAHMTTAATAMNSPKMIMRLNFL